VSLAKYYENLEKKALKKEAIILELEKFYNTMRLTLPENTDGQRMYGYTKAIVRKVQDMVEEL
tara:strand:- start:259 stop:447 length:189 start_codon:yes stop_codon:yes gene_type:complete